MMKRKRAPRLLPALLLAATVTGSAAPSRAASVSAAYQVVTLGPSPGSPFYQAPAISNAGAVTEFAPHSEGSYTLQQPYVPFNGSFAPGGNFLYQNGGTVNLLPASLQGALNTRSADDPYFFRDGSRIGYPTYLQYPAPSVSGFNASGQVVGNHNTFPHGSNDPFFYDTKTGQYVELKALPGAIMAPVVKAINGQDQIVALQGGVNGQGQVALFYSSPTAVPVDLNTLIPSSSGWHLGSATGINDKGEIVGAGTTPDGRVADFKLEPQSLGSPVTVPEPSPLWVFGLAVPALALRSIMARRGATAGV